MNPVPSDAARAHLAVRLRVRLSCVFAIFALAHASAGDWLQWGGNPQHQGSAPVAGQSLSMILAEVVCDPFAPDEAAHGGGGDLTVHYAVPLIDDTGVYLELKSGTWVETNLNLQVWGVRKLVWKDSVLTEVWRFSSDWKPEPTGSFEPVFHPVLAGDFLYVPGVGGSVYKLSRETGAVVSVARPFPSDPSIFVAGGLAADASGNVYYNALRLKLADPWESDALGAWLVRLGSDDSTSLVSYSAIVPGAPAAASLCRWQFSTEPLPWPPSPTAVPPSKMCGSQRPSLNAVPAIAPDGTIYTVSQAHLNNRYSYLVAVRPDLKPLWAVSLRGLLNDGCDVSMPPSGTPGGCRAGATRGVDPTTNEQPAGRLSDLSTASPVVLPDGAVLIGTVSSYNYLRGHLFKFSAAGSALANYDFGWDLTPAVFAHDGTYSILIKDNHYEVGSYCGSPTCPDEPGRYDLTSLDANLVPEWHFTGTNTFSCERGTEGSITCVSDHADGFEWCVNQPAVDAAGVVYANSEDGFLYAVGRDGKLKERIFLDRAIGAAYTPVSLDSAGRIYAQNFGKLFVVGDIPPRASVTSLPAPKPRAVQPR